MPVRKELLANIRRRRLLVRMQRDEIDRRLERGENVDPAEIQALLDDVQAMKEALLSWRFVVSVVEGKNNEYR